MKSALPAFLNPPCIGSRVMKHTLSLLTVLLLTSPAAIHAADAAPSAAPRDDGAWLKEEGALIFHRLSLRWRA
jgi:hypothetical protein